jgi:hypothetical protein
MPAASRTRAGQGFPEYTLPFALATGVARYPRTQPSEAPAAADRGEQGTATKASTALEVAAHDCETRDAVAKRVAVTSPPSPPPTPNTMPREAASHTDVPLRYA